MGRCSSTRMCSSTTGARVPTSIGWRGTSRAPSVFSPRSCCWSFDWERTRSLVGDKVDQLRAVFPDDRVIAPTPDAFDRAGTVFREMFTPGREPKDRLGLLNDIPIALTARQIGAAVISQNVHDFRQIAEHLPGLRIVNPAQLDSRFQR